LGMVCESFHRRFANAGGAADEDGGGDVGDGFGEGFILALAVGERGHRYSVLKVTVKPGEGREKKRRLQR
jgi:hypothetical protein